MSHAFDGAGLENLFAGGGEMGALMRSLDWSQTPLGSVETWPQSLRSALSICLNSRFPIAIYWGQDCLLLYNDAWRPIIGDKHPWSLSRPGREVWSEIWDDIGPELASVLATGEGTFHKDELLSMHRFGYTEECFFEYTFNPIQGEGGSINGVFNIVTETTYRVLNDRRAQLLQTVASKAGTAKTAQSACALMVETLRADRADIPFALLYLMDRDGKALSLCGSTEIDVDRSIAPLIVDLAADDTNGWSIALVAQAAQSQIIHDLEMRFGTLPGSPWLEPPQEAMVLPIAATGQGKIAGVLVAAASPRRRLDDNYLEFFHQVARHIAMAIANARSYEEERRRAEQLVELDRAKTVFFSNASHEFRTPLTLMLGPTEDALSDPDDPLSANQQARIETVQRNGLRLLKLVNTLLDFSRIEAGRVEATYEPTDLAAYTAELASVFRSTIERANLRLVVDCPPLPFSVYVDRQMWEKIVLNLLSNAFKFTFVGEISVSLQWQSDRVELAVRDTGIGIPAAELHFLFERFHRVKGLQGRSIEGSGIGLSLVQELVKLHQGAINVTSVEGAGSCFTISIPRGTAHLPQERIEASRTLASTALGANPYLEEAQRWLSYTDREVTVLKDGAQSLPSRTDNSFSSAKILLADDNADMRDYVRRLLSQHYIVEAVSDGLGALSAVRQQVPDLILTDVMMPNMDGFGLLQALRSNPQTREVPIIMLSARAGEESRIEGLAAGADDYLIKPFSARELLARVEASLKLARLRREAGAALRESEEKYRTLFESIDQGFCIIEMIFNAANQPINYRFLIVNPAFDKQTGKENAQGKTVREIAPQHEDYWFEIYGKVALTGESIRFENCAEEFHRWYEVHAFRIGDPELRRVGILFNDISDRKQAQAEREQLLHREQAAREQAEQANRIKDEFLAVLSHELRSPLNPILGWARLLQTGKLDMARQAEALKTIERNANLQTQLIEDLLDISRIMQGKLSLTATPVSLTFVVSAAVDTVRLAAEAKNIQIALDLDFEIAPVCGDATRLQQVMWNLLTNAVKFTPNSGQVSVEMRSFNSLAQIRVIDTGKGINPQFLPHVFEYFRQEDSSTTRKFGGLGLGLAIVRQIVEMHGGKVRAESLGENQGATFIVQLPLMQQANRIASEPIHTPIETEVPLDGVQILLVDDEPDTREFQSFVLEQSGATVTAVASGKEALQALDLFTFDVLVSDIGMAQMDGYMLMQQIRDRPPNQGGSIRAIALTAYAADIDQQKALQVGFQTHITKPVEPEELVGTIVNLLESD